MDNNTQALNVEVLFSKACELPYCHIDRKEFLTKELKNRICPDQLADALENGTMKADISVDVLDNIAESSITLETTKATLISTAAGIPGGFAMIGTVPADLAQYYAHVFEIAQKLAYIYGSKDLELADSTQNEIMLYLGVMFGAGAANAAITKITANAAKIGASVAAKPLTKYAIYNITKKVMAWVGVKITKDVFGKAVAKAVPVVGGVVSGGLTVGTFLPMAKKLQKHLSKLAAMSPEDLAKENEAADAKLAKYTELTVESSAEESIKQG